MPRISFPQLPKPWGLPLGLALLVGGLTYLGYFLDRSDFAYLLASFGLAFLGYAILLGRLKAAYLLPVGLVLRLLLLPSTPTLSDDYFRFIWDGLLSASGINPFAQLPEAFMDSTHSVQGIDQELFEKLNSSEYFTVYPPLSQFWFWLAALWGKGVVWKHLLVMRLGILLAELGTLIALKKLLRHYGLPLAYLAWYALNPLVIIELTGNLHFEAFMIAGILWAGYGLVQKNWLKTAIFLSFGVLAKLLPLMLLPSLLPVLGWKKSLYAYLLVGALVVLGFLPFLDATLIESLSSSLSLYFQRFEFNASIYYIIRWIGYQLEGYNIIQWAGPALSVAVLLGILAISLLPPYHAQGSLKKWMWIYVLYLLGATIVHPWYCLVLLPLSLFTPYRFPFIWSFSIVFSYTTYRTEAYNELLWLTALSYALALGYAVWERFFRPKRQNPLNVFKPTSSRIGSI